MKGKIILIFFIILVFLALGGSTYYFYNQYQNAQKLLANPTEAAKIETQKLISQLKKFIDLPVKEDPTIATIIDATKLKDQPFFANAKNGDKVILYVKARKAILYRPSEIKIIDVSPLTLESQKTDSQNQTASVKVVLYNGTESADLTQKAEDNLKQKYVDVEIVAKDNAIKQNYQSTIVIDLNGTKKDIVNQLANDFKGEAAALPEDEKKPQQEADILIILGANYK